MVTALRIRTAVARDADWLLPLSARLHDFGPPKFRPRDQMDRAVAADIGGSTRAPGSEAVVFVVEEEGEGGRRPLGFVHVRTLTDYFTAEAHGHVSDLVVAENAEGRGAGAALMAAAEDWSRSRGIVS